MKLPLRSPQNRFVFGNQHAWTFITTEERSALGFPCHLSDQIFAIHCARTPVALLFELTVSEQCPKDTYTRIAQCLAALPAEYLVVSIGHARNAGTHLIFHRREQNRVFHHLDLDPTHPSPFDIELIQGLHRPSPRRMRALFEMIDKQSLSQTFFVTLRRMLRGLHCTSETAYYAVVDLLLKLIFLIFVQRKGWLNFDPYYLETKMAACHSRGLSITTILFKPLFAALEGLPCASELTLGTLPRLGGGLFHFRPELLPRLDNDWILELYSTLVSQFSFSLLEAVDGRRVLGISPEVLGHVFENLLIDEDRKSNGTFYTPLAAAEGQVRAALAAWRSHNCPDEASWQAALPGLRILDPSCGSGTYLVVAFSILVQENLAFRPEAERFNGKLFALKKEIVLNNLFGVDIQPMAIKLAEVRLWLNMIQDLEIADPTLAPALPNLRHHLRPGDFLARHVPSGSEQIPHWPKYAQLEKVRRLFPESSPSSRPAYLRQLYRLEQELADWLAEQKDRDERERVHEARRQLALPGQERFTSPVCFEPAPRTTHLLHVVFSQVFLEGGFQLIVGNPPWLRSECIAHAQKAQIQERLRLPAGLRLEGQADLSLYFTAAALSLLKPAGHLSFLLPAKLLNARYAAQLRTWAMRHATIDYLHDYGIDHKLLFRAATFPLALGLTLAQPRPEHQLTVERTDRDQRVSYGLTQAQLGEHRGVWLLDRPADAAMAHWPRLSELPIAIAMGIRTGAKRELTFERLPQQIDRELLRPLLRGRDIQTDRARPSGWIFWPFGLGADWFDQLGHNQRRWLATTGQLQRSGARTWLPYRPRPLGRWVLIWKYLAKTFEVALLRGEGWVPDQTTYYMNFTDFTSAYRTFAYFHSDQAQKWLHAVAERGKDRHFFYYAHTVGSLPIPPDLNTAPLTIPPERELMPHEGKGLWTA